MPAETGTRRNALKARRARGRSVSARVQVSEMQRARLLAAAVASIAELGYARASVAHITARARVSRRTFYDLFAGREDCLLAVLEDTVEQIGGEIRAADLGGLVWRERVRGGLLVILSFLDREPVLARVCVVGALQGGPRVLAWRTELLAGLAEILDEGRGESSRECTVLTAEGLVGAALSIVYARLSANGRRRESLRGLLGELMSLIVLPYLGPAVARQEQPPLPRVERAASRNSRGGVVVERDPLREVPMRLTYRTALVLQAASEYPGASNRRIGEHAEIHDQGQISKLLGRLERIGLLTNTGAGQSKGEPNAWRLTPLGERVTQQLSLSTPLQEDAA
ncbi:MAG TPA: TetR/AcrR family transcriptional regulator [Solirubrobacteraceae bacterium]|jgi:AcrR family transcriptional regulator|nr:TetR/AcrR family transcriptional regulator [Solirubrobacteraceae bacterium]